MTLWTAPPLELGLAKSARLAEQSDGHQYNLSANRLLYPLVLEGLG